MVRKGLIMHRVNVVYFDNKEFSYSFKDKEIAEDFLKKKQSDINVKSVKYIGSEK